MRSNPLSMERVVSNARTSKTIWVFLLVASIISIYKIYSVTTGGDFQYYVKNGMSIANGVNPYATDFRSGTFGPLVLHLFSKFIPEGAINNVFFILNLLGIYSIFIYFKSRLAPNVMLFSLTIIIWSAPYREIVIDGQITSFLYLLIFSSLILISNQSGKFGSVTNLISAAFLSSIAIDLKPHICLPIVLFIGFAQRKLNYLYSVGFILLISHASIDIWLGSFTEIEWIQNMMGVQSGTQFSEWPEQYNVWPILDNFIPAYVFWKSVSLLFALLTLILLSYLSLKKREELIWLTVASFSMVIPYSHLYSLTLLIALTLIRILNSELNSFGYLFIVFILVPRFWIAPINVAFVLGFLSMTSLFNAVEKKSSLLENSKYLAKCIALNIVIHFSNDVIVLDENVERSLVCVLIVLLAAIVLAKRKFQNSQKRFSGRELLR